MVYNAANGATLDKAAFLQKPVVGQLDGLVTAYLVTAITKLEYQTRFTTEERIAIRTEAKTDPVVEYILALMDSVTEITLNDPRTIYGENKREALRHIGEGRAAEILAL